MTTLSDWSLIIFTIQVPKDLFKKIVVDTIVIRVRITEADFTVSV